MILGWDDSNKKLRKCYFWPKKIVYIIHSFGQKKILRKNIGVSLNGVRTSFLGEISLLDYQNCKFV